MKPITSLALLGALTSIAAHGAVTTPVGYYEYSGKSGLNLCVPALVNPAAFSGAITGSGATTLDFAASSFTGGEFDAGVTYPTHFVEITSGPNAGVVVDIVSNTTAQVVLADDISGLSLVGTESVTIRPHVVLGDLFSNEDDMGDFQCSATFYFQDGTSAFFFYSSTTVGGWTTGATPDGDAVPIVPGTGFVLQLVTDLALTVTGEVKSTPTVVQLPGGGIPVIVGPSNPLVGTNVALATIFSGMNGSEFAQTYPTTGDFSAPLAGYFGSPTLGLTTDFVNPTVDTLPATTGAVFVSAGTALIVDPLLP